MSLLSADELKELTDSGLRLNQIEWLRARGWRFELSWTKRPKVDREEYRKRMISGEAEEKHPTPDLSWFNGQKKTVP